MRQDGSNQNILHDGKEQTTIKDGDCCSIYWIGTITSRMDTSTERCEPFYRSHPIITESPCQTCFERLLALNQVVPPPARLIHFFQEREPEYLIRTYLRYGMVSAALDTTLTLVDEVCYESLWPCLSLSTFAVQCSCVRHEAVSPPYQRQAHVKCICT